MRRGTLPLARRQARRRQRLRLAAALAIGAATGLAAPPSDAQLHSLKGTSHSKRAPIVFRADEVEYDDQRALTIAKGHVEISQGNEILLADTVTYNQRTDTVTASGNVSLLQPSGEILFSKYMELRDGMNDAFATNVRMLLSDHSRLAANTARRTNGDFTELRRGVYSPCDLCKSDPSAPPAWQLKAREMSDDKQQHLLEFRDATMEVDGWPIFYTPYISQPDPSVKRASGFLPPSIGSSNTLGAHVEIPYYWVLGPDKDLTLAPRLTTSAGVLMASEYRQRFSNGTLDAIGSVNYSDEGVGQSTATSDAWRGHINASGVWDIDSTYRTGFQLQRVSDQSYLLRFGFPMPLLSTEISRAYLEGFDARGGTDVDAYVFQPLLPGLGDSTQPIVLPVINRDWESAPDAWGGRWHLNANLLNIVREVGTQTRRLSLGAEWDKSFRDGIGGEYKLSASLRGDTYSVSDLSPLSNPELPSSYFSIDGAPPISPIDYNYVAARAFPQLGLHWDYPLVHRGSTTTALIEPIAAAFVGPSGGNMRRIPDEDSLAFNFNDADLFRADRLAGYDVLDTGQRVDYGMKWALYNNDGGSYRLLIGQSARAEDNTFMPAGSGAEKRISDVVGRLVLAPSAYVDMIYRFRLDRSSLNVRSQEFSVNGGPQSLRLGVNFLLLPAQQAGEEETNPFNGQTVLFGKREQLSFSVNTKLTRYWSINGSETVNLTNSNNIVNGIVTPQSNSSSLFATLSAVYQDECMAFISSISQSGIRNGDVTPGVSVMFSVVFKNIGEIGGNILSVGGSG